MQSVKGILFFLCLSLVFPPYFAHAATEHFSTSQLAQIASYQSPNNELSVNFPAGKYDSLDAYIFESDPAGQTGDLPTVGPVYEYYFASDQITADDLFQFNLKLDPALTVPQSAYYYDSAKNLWLPAEIIGQNSLSQTFQLKGNGGKIVLVKNSATQTKGLAAVSSDGLLTVNLPAWLAKEQPVISITPQLIPDFSFAKVIVSNLYQISVTGQSGADLSQILALGPSKTDCSDYLTKAIVTGRKNNINDVKRLQRFLSGTAGFGDVQVTGNYDKITASAISKFQEQYAKQILTPFGLTKGTGQVYSGTLRQINKLYCQSQAEDSSAIRISLKYRNQKNSAKAMHSLSTGENGMITEVQSLDSFDNHKSQSVLGLAKKTDLSVFLAADDNQWVGEASWYKFKNGNFAASRDFPKGTKLKVTNQQDGLNRGRSVIVTVNDYGPEAWTNRIIDLDKVAFEQIGIASLGVMPVKVELADN